MDSHQMQDGNMPRDGSTTVADPNSSKIRNPGVSRPDTEQMAAGTSRQRSFSERNTNEVATAGIKRLASSSGNDTSESVLRYQDFSSKASSEGTGGAKKTRQSDVQDGKEGGDHWDLNSLDEEEEDLNWVEPDYADRKWFNKSCLSCQVCGKEFKQIHEAVTCVKKHKKVRCYMCFYVFKGGDLGAKRLYRHFRNRHVSGYKPETVHCPQCDKLLGYGVVTNHMITDHFSTPLGVP